jgi:hypothetical protein
VDGVGERVPLWGGGVVLGDTVEPVVVPQPEVRLTVAAWGMLMVDAPMRVAADSKAAVDGGRMGRRDAEPRTVGLRTRPLFCGEGGDTRKECSWVRERSRTQMRSEPRGDRVLYYLIQFVGHASQGPKSTNNFAPVTGHRG